MTKTGQQLRLPLFFCSGGFHPYRARGGVPDGSMRKKTREDAGR